MTSGKWTYAKGKEVPSQTWTYKLKKDKWNIISLMKRCTRAYDVSPSGVLGLKKALKCIRNP
jgi:hypothetical protein